MFWIFMKNDDKELKLKLSDFQSEGLWLLFTESLQLALTQDIINQFADLYLGDPNKLPLAIRKANDFQACNHCPKEKYELCTALKPILPFLEDLDHYQSYDKVTAIFHSAESDVLHMSYTTMQQALKYVTMLSLVFSCESSERYRRYFRDTNPLMEPDAIASRVFANIYLDYQGEKNKIVSIISELKSTIDESTHCIIKRLRLICKNDAFINALVNTGSITSFLELETEKHNLTFDHSLKQR